MLRPNTSGLLIRKIDFIVLDHELEINLPNDSAEEFETLSNDIYNALSRNEPTLVLDRLHTYTTRFLREICEKHKVRLTDDRGNYLPLHSLMGSLVKFYNDEQIFDSNFTIQALKMSISLFEKFNEIRNKNSLRMIMMF